MYRLFCDLHGPCMTALSKGLTKILVITDIIENNISLEVISGKLDWKMGHATRYLLNTFECQI